MRSNVTLLTLALALAPAAHSQSNPPPDVLLRGNTEDNGFGSAVSLAGDVNADGVADLVVGAEAFDDVEVAQGRVFLFYGPLGPNVSFNQADATMTGEALFDGFGNSVAGVGDVNNDGFDDILVGARSNDTAGIQAGRAYLFYGPLAGNRAALSADAIISGDPFDELGWAVAGAGDVNADGFDDLLIGAWMAGNGEAVLFHGPLAGSLTIGQANATIQGVEFSEQLGKSVAAADMNQDGRNDLVVGAPRPPVNGQGTGRVYIFFSPISGVHPATDADVVIMGEALNDEFGSAVAGAGDVNGDGAEDLVVGAHQLFRPGDGRAYVFYGPLPPGTIAAANAGAVLLGEPPVVPEEEDTFGEAVASAGDTDADGFDDIVVAASNNRAGGVRAGRAYIFRGPLAGTLPASAAARVITGGSQNLLGTSLAPVGDLNGDGSDDVFVGAPAVFESGVQEYAGVYFGETTTSGGPPPTGSPEITLTVAGPNPSGRDSRLILTVGRTQPVRVVALDVLGRHVADLFDGTVRRGEVQALVLDGTGLASGVYLVRARGDRGTAGRLLTLR